MLIALMHTALLSFLLIEAKTAAHGHTACKRAELELKPRPDLHGWFLETKRTSPHESLTPSTAITSEIS